MQFEHFFKHTGDKICQCFFLDCNSKQGHFLFEVELSKVGVRHSGLCFLARMNFRSRSRILCVRHAVSLKIEKSLTNWFQLLENWLLRSKGLVSATWPPRQGENTLRTDQKKETIHEMKDKYWARISEWPPSLWWWTPNLTLKNIGALSSFTRECVYTFYNWPSLMTIEFFSNRHCFPPYENKIGNSCGVFWVDPGTFIIIEKDIWLWVSPKYSHNILISQGYLYQ